MSILHRIKNLDYKIHLVFAFLIRCGFIIYGIHHDKNSIVPYTDIDYRVFTDAARHLINFESPYKRHTYRYSPLIAILLIPNILVHDCFGKFLFSAVDILVGYFIRVIVENLYKTYKQHVTQYETKIENKPNLLITSTVSNQLNEKRKSNKQGRLRRKSKSFSKNIKLIRGQKEKDSVGVIADVSMCIWLYNPLSIAIATRGNSDTIAGLLVLLVLYYMQVKHYFIAGLLHGVAIHLRLYPIVYSLTLFMHLSQFSYYETESRKNASKAQSSYKPLNSDENNSGSKRNKKSISLCEEQRKTIFKKEYLLYLLPNSDQLKLIFGCLLSLTALTAFFFLLYGYTFLYETYIYHLMRSDSRHNFSLYFYLQYLTAGVKRIGIWQKVLIILPKIVLLLVLSVRYGLNKYSLNFSVLSQTLVIVLYNTVLTSQYFIWILSILPLCIWQLNINIRKSVSLFTLWFAAQVAWLLPAYFLEFQGQNTFFLIWLQSISLFCAHIAIMGRLIKYFTPISSHEE